tara:strand:+ start:134 stop:406 length:273 start_codon:yes stop_codon:yes gene_type:complete
MAIIGKETPELEKQYRFQWEEAQECYVLLYPEGLIKLPGSAGEIMKQIDGTLNIDEIINNLETKFPGTKLRDDVIDFLEIAYEKGWIKNK